MMAPFTRLAVLLLAPTYLLAGHGGAIVLLIVIAGLAATAIYLLTARLTTPGIALTTWAAVTLTVPFLSQSWQLRKPCPCAISCFRSDLKL